MKFVLIGAFFAIFSDVYVTRSYARKSAYNITGKWYLPRFDSPVFYLHFRDRISWIEADAVCQFHHSQLVTVDRQYQYEDVEYYLDELLYDEPVWIGLRQNCAEAPFKWTNDKILDSGSDQFWRRKPTAEEEVPLCVMSSPSDDFHWTAHRCNGPDVASFICEMPVPEWAQKSGCMVPIENVTVTFHPQIKMVAAGKACINDSDVNYVECRDQIEDKEAKERAKIVAVKRLNCPQLTSTTHESSSSSPTPKTINGTRTTASAGNPPFLSFPDMIYLNKIAGSSVPSWPNMMNMNINLVPVITSSASEEIRETVGTSSEPSIVLPQEMSFAEEPIKASKPFEEQQRESTDGPFAERSGANKEETAATSQVKFNSKNINFIPTPLPEKAKWNKSGGAVVSDSSTTENSSRRTSISIISVNTTNEDSSRSKFTPAMSTTTTMTDSEESHEAFNNDKSLEAFQNSSPAVEKQKSPVITTTFSNNKVVEPKLSKDFVFDGSEEEAISARTYNIEGTFISNDFINVDPAPITVRKKIDLTPLESKVVKGTTVRYETNADDKSSSKNFVSESSSSVTVTRTESSEATRFTTDAVKISSSVSTTTNVKTTPSSVAPTTAHSQMEERTKETSTPVGSFTTVKGKEEPSNKTETVRRRLSSGLLMIVNDDSDEKKQPNRKRQIYTERHSFYPYFLGRILG